MRKLEDLLIEVKENKPYTYKRENFWYVLYFEETKLHHIFFKKQSIEKTVSLLNIAFLEGIFHYYSNYRKQKIS